MTDEPVKTGVNRKPGTFVKGDPRINRRGRLTRDQDAERKEWQRLLAEYVMDENGQPMIDRATDKPITNLKAGMRMAVHSRNPQHFIAALERAFGKPKERIEHSGELVQKVIIEYADDSQDQTAEITPGATPGEAGTPEI